MLPKSIRMIMLECAKPCSYIGARNTSYTHTGYNYDGQEIRPSRPSYLDEDGVPVGEISYTFRPNTRRRTFMTVTYEPDDTYTLYFYTISTRKGKRTGKVLEKIDRLFWNGTLGDAIEHTYNEYIKTVQGGFFD